MVKSIKEIIKTSRGDVSRFDITFWGDVHTEYMNKRDAVLVSKELGIDVRMMKNIFKELGLATRSSKESRLGKVNKNYVETKEGTKIELEDKTFWDSMYDKYIKESYSETRLSDLIGISRKQLRRVFKFHNYPPKTDSQIKQTIVNSSLEIYGTTIPSKNSDIKNKIRNSHLDREDTVNKNRLVEEGYIILDDYIGLHSVSEDVPSSWIKYNFEHLECGTKFEDDFSRHIRCPKCFPNFYSKKEDLIREYITVHNLPNSKIKLSNNKEVDIFIPELRIGFEYNGVRFHSSLYQGNYSYHKDKTETCLLEGIKLYHIWEHDDIDIVKSMILNKSGKTPNKYFARKLTTEEVNVKERREFFNSNHLHGDVKAKFALGLYNGTELISCISFRSHKEGIEIARFATKLNSSVVGGFQKLLKYSKIKCRELGFNKIVTYCDRDWTPSHEDSVYFKNGFKFIKDTGVQLRYYNENTREVESRETYQKHKLKELFFDYGGSNVDEFLQTKRIYTLHNSGNWKFTLDI